MPEVNMRLNGKRVRIPNKAEVYMIDEGRRRLIPNPDTYNNLFVSWNDILLDPRSGEIETGTPLTDGASLVQGEKTPEVFLLDGREKRFIANPETMDAYGFNWKKVKTMSKSALDILPNGSVINIAGPGPGPKEPGPHGPGPHEPGPHGPGPHGPRP